MRNGRKAAHAQSEDRLHPRPGNGGVPRLVELIQAGVDVARLKSSHGGHEDHRTMYADIRAAAKQVGRPIPVLADLCGPKIRVGMMQGGQVMPYKLKGQ